MNYDLPKSKIVYNLTIKLNLYINNDFILINDISYLLAYLNQSNKQRAWMEFQNLREKKSDLPKINEQVRQHPIQNNCSNYCTR